MELDSQYSINKVVKSNIEYITQQGRFHDFACSFFFQMKIIYEYVNEIKNTAIEINKEQKDNKTLSSTTNVMKGKNAEALRKIIKERNLIVITLIKVLFEYSDFKKSRFVRSGDQVLFIPHLGGDDITINGEFNAVLQRIIYAHDIAYYQTLINNIEDTARLNPKLKVIDGFDNNQIFFERKSMSNFLKNFVKSMQILELNEKYGLKVQFPESYYLNLTEFTNLLQLKTTMRENNLKLPLIIKFEGDKNSVMKHLMFIILSESGLLNFIEYCSKYNKDGKSALFILLDLYFVIQNFNNHGGSVLKQYRSCSQGKVYFRHSIPDLHESYENEYEEFKNGYMHFQTSDLASESFHKFW